MEDHVAEEKQEIAVRIESTEERRAREREERQKERAELLAQVLGYGATAGPGVAFPSGFETLEDFNKARTMREQE